MKPCNKVSEDARLECKEALVNFKDQKTKRNELLQEIGMGPTSMNESALSKTIGTLGSGSGSGSGSVSGSGEPIPREPMDKFTSSQPRQTTLNSKWKQEERKEVCRKIGRFMYSKGLPFNTMNDPYWFPMIDVVANFGSGFKPPSIHELRTWILKKEVNDLSIIMEDHKKAWKQYGCSIMSDGWTDGKSRCLINFLVVEEIGEENIVQVITYNASNYVNVGMRLMEKMRKLWWTPCATHCIDLMLEDIGKLNVHATTLSQARQQLHDMLLYFLLSKVFISKQALIAMFSSEKWCSSTWAKKVEGVKTRSTVLFDPNFWPHVAFCIKTIVPLVSVLREVDSEERPAMGYIYELMDSAKEKIAFTCRGVERKYDPIWRKIDARWTPQLHRPLHAAGYYLNPQLQYRDKFSNADELQDNELFNVDAIRAMSSNSQETKTSSDHMVPSHSYKRKHNEVPSTSGGKGKEKELNLTPIDEDEDLHEMGIHDSGHFPTIDTLDEGDDDLRDEDLS
ncbi:hypothetical protein CK203_113739 [Vitis vinifera]|uniref:DUF659 domain-containing protein n=1 Tax=Vitis vinifera TaxID=29760 RepID=A0A438EIV5_VITVI|nr:hypothetical protein CK203_113739 [Vitis vinifera]